MSISQTLKLIAAVALVAGLFVYRQHLIGEGEARVLAADARVVEAKKVSNAEVERRAKLKIDQATATLRASLATRPVDSPHLRLRPCPAPDRGTLPADATTGPATPGNANVPSVVAGISQESLNRLTDAADRRFKDDDAKMNAWQAWYAECVKAGVCLMEEVAARNP